MNGKWLACTLLFWLLTTLAAVLGWKVGYRTAQIVEVERFHQKAMAVHDDTIRQLKAQHAAQIEYMRLRCSCETGPEIE